MKQNVKFHIESQIAKVERISKSLIQISKNLLALNEKVEEHRKSLEEIANSIYKIGLRIPSEETSPEVRSQIEEYNDKLLKEKSDFIDKLVEEYNIPTEDEEVNRLLHAAKSGF